MEEGKAKILLQVSGRKNPELEKYNVAWSMDVVPDSHKPLFKMLNPILDLARPYFAPPNVPADRTAILRDAFGKLVDDQQFAWLYDRPRHCKHLFLPTRQLAGGMVPELLDRREKREDPGHPGARQRASQRHGQVFLHRQHLP